MKKTIILLVFSLLTAISVSSENVVEEPKLDNPNSYTVIVVPDTQGYSKNSVSQPICDMMMAWIAAHKKALNIQMVLHTGDLVEHDDRIIIDGYSGDQTSMSQWIFIANSFRKLDGVVPYLAALGNHDYTYCDTDGGKKTQYSKYFYTDKNPQNRKLLCQNMTDKDGNPTLENSMYEWISPNGKPYIFMQLEYGPRDTVLTWAKNILAMEKYKNHRVVLLTHAYLDDKNNRLNEKVSMSSYNSIIINGEVERTRPILKDANCGEDIFKKLVYPSSNIELVVCGHIAGYGYRKDKNIAGKEVHQMLFDAQNMDGGYEGNGGDGWLRILEFYPDERTVKVKTFSPLFFISEKTRNFATWNDPENEFVFTFSK